jgi:hypothetical protein
MKEDTQKGSVKHRALLLTALPVVALTVTATASVVQAAPSTGYVEVCKYADGPYISGYYKFTITHAGGSLQRSVLVGQCSGPIAVAAGSATVTETAVANTTVSSIATYPSGRAVSKNLTNRTITVSVPVGAQNNETMVSFYNRAVTGMVKVCKFLAYNASALNGSTWDFYLTSRAAGSSSLSVVAGTAYGEAACKISTVKFPIGDVVTISEGPANNVLVSSVVIQPAANNAGSWGSTAQLKVSGGITTATFTNKAMGTLEVCKDAADDSTAGTVWNFVVNAGYDIPINVPAGECSGPMTVRAGTATIEELSQPNFSLKSVATDDPSRLLTGKYTNPAKVSVPFGGSNAGGNETVVTFTNAVNTGQFKICKESPESSLQQHSFHFDASWTVNGKAGSKSADLLPGHCSSLSSRIPVVNQGGSPVEITVTESQTDATIMVSSIALAGNGSLSSSDNNTGTATFSLGSGGTSTLTYTNVRTPI